MFALLAGVSAVAILGGTIFTAICLRRVVSTNEVHIVQRATTTTSYGNNTTDKKGNVYYEWPNWIPVIGVNKIILPVSVFKLELDSYDAYDKDRLPFEIDLVAFFRVVDSNMAAQRVSSVKELEEQLTFILKGAARTILASYDVDTIMVERSKFGDHFTTEVEAQLKQWGVATVKNIELMDIRDSKDNKVIQNIMAKRKSAIEMESRTEVAQNMQKAQIAETVAKQAVEMQQQMSRETVGTRTIEANQTITIADQQASQAIKEQERITKEKEMAVLQTASVRQAEITKNTTLVKAEQDKQATILTAEGALEAKKRTAEGIIAEGNAKAEAEKAMQLAPVQAQITLAKEIGENKSYQEYLVTIRKVEADQVVGVEQAKALQQAQVKVISNSGDPVKGIGGVMDLFSANGGTKIGSMLEGLAQTEQGQALIAKVVSAGIPASKPNGVGH